MPYEISNRQTSLTISFHQIRRQIGAYLDLGRNPATWDDEEVEVVQDTIDDGVRQAYFPPSLTAPTSLGTIESHEWSFMRPVYEFVTEADQRRYALPEDLDRIIGNLAYLDDQYGYAPIKVTSASRLRALEFRTTDTSAPEWAAIEPAMSTGESPQTQILVLQPTPDAAYRLGCQYQAAARRLTAAQPYPLGGQMFGPVVLSSCLSVAELFKTGQHGAHHNLFLSRLATAIARDQKRGAQYLGQNNNGMVDGFISRGELRRAGLLTSWDAMTFDGVVPD